MIILSYNPGHDGAIACLQGGRLLFSTEAEKNSNYRYSPISSSDLLNALGALDEIPDAVCVGGWWPRDHYEHVHGSHVHVGQGTFMQFIHEKAAKSSIGDGICIHFPGTASGAIVAFNPCYSNTLRLRSCGPAGPHLPLSPPGEQEDADHGTDTRRQFKSAAIARSCFSVMASRPFLVAGRCSSSS